MTPTDLKAAARRVVPVDEDGCCVLCDECREMIERAALAELTRLDAEKDAERERAVREERARCCHDPDGRGQCRRCKRNVGVPD